MNRKKAVITSEDIVHLNQYFAKKERAYRKAKRFNDALARLKEMLAK